VQGAAEKWAALSSQCLWLGIPFSSHDVSWYRQQLYKEANKPFPLPTLTPDPLSQGGEKTNTKTPAKKPIPKQTSVE